MKARALAGSREQTSSERLGLLRFAAWLFLLAAVGRLGELIPGISWLPLVKIALGIAVIVMAMRWKMLMPMQPRARPLARLAVILGLLAIVSTAFSIWPGKSLAFVLGQLPLLVASVILIYKLAYDWMSLRNLFLALTAAGGVLTLVTLSQFGGGRASAGSTYDTNDLAYVLVTVLPVALAFALTAPTRGRRLMYFGLVGAMAVTILLTSSRGGMLGLMAAMGVVVLDSGRLQPAQAAGEQKQKKAGEQKKKNKKASRLIASLFACLAAALIVWPFLPDETRTRLSSVFSLESDYNLDASNKTGRSAIWKRGMNSLLERPIGYGIDAYMMVDLRAGGKMNTAHSSIVQISVELGFIGMFLFLSLYLQLWRGLAKARAALQALPTRSEQHEQHALFLRMLQASVLGNFIAGLFLSVAYVTIFWVIIAFVMACVAQAPPPEESKRTRRVVR